MNFYLKLLNKYFASETFFQSLETCMKGQHIYLNFIHTEQENTDGLSWRRQFFIPSSNNWKGEKKEREENLFSIY